jgi:hypothetical protein
MSDQLKTQNLALITTVILLALAHGIAYALLIPPWQAPDEPRLFEYVALTATLGRIPTANDRDLELEQAITGSLERHNFWQWVGRSAPSGLQNLNEVGAYVPMPRQVGGDPPLYFALAALALRPALGWPIEQQLYLLRLLNVLLLPGVVWFAWNMFRDPHRGQAQRPAPTPLIVVAPALCIFIALHPMFIAASAQVGNDGLANLVGAALCWAILGQVGQPLTFRGMLLIGGLLLVGLFTKRTLAPFVLVVMIWLLNRGFSGLRGLTRIAAHTPNIRAHPRQPWLIGILSIIAITLIAVQIDWRSAGGWIDPTNERPLPRTGNGGALLLAAGQEALQPLPDIGVAALRGDAVRFGAIVRGENVSGRLMIIAAGVVQSEQRFTVVGEQQLVGSGYLPRDTPDLWISIVAENGPLEVDNLWLRGGRLPGNQLANGRINWPALMHQSPLAQLSAYSRLPEVSWAVRSGYILRPPIFRSVWWNTLFESFWGNFGWLTVPMLTGTFWLPALALFCIGAGMGLLVQLFSKSRLVELRQQVIIALLIGGAALALIIFNSLTAADGAPQGRYLFPALSAIGLCLVWGALGWLSQRWQWYGLCTWVAFWSLYAGSTLWRLGMYYNG